MTHHLCLAHMPERISKNTKSKGGDPTLPKQEQPLVGPQAVRFDTFSLLRWSLMTHGGYVTYPHKDANGLCTWLYANVGVKVLAILEPRYSPEHATRRAQFKLNSDVMRHWEHNKVSDMYTTFLAPGDMLFDFRALRLLHFELTLPVS
jgi:hypothetical protein